MYTVKLRFRGETRTIAGVTAWREEAGALVLTTADGVQQRHELAHFADQTAGRLASWAVSQMQGDRLVTIAVGG